MDPDAPLRKYVGLPEDVVWRLVQIRYLLYAYDDEREVAFRWNLQTAICTWLAYEADIDLNAWKRQLSKPSPQEDYVR